MRCLRHSITTILTYALRHYIIAIHFIKIVIQLLVCLLVRNGYSVGINNHRSLE